MLVVFCTPFIDRPTKPFIEALEKTVPVLEKAGWKHALIQERGNPYISNARALLTRKAIDLGADVIMFLDYDVSWEPQDMLKILNTKGDVVAGLYRHKKHEVEFMGVFGSSRPLIREDGCILAEKVPAGFLKITPEAVARFARHYHELTFGDPLKPHVDLFNHGAINHVWHGEDFAFSHRWNAMGGQIWVCPDLNLTHHGTMGPCFGNFHQYLLENKRRQDQIQQMQQALDLLER